jgi:aspartate/methionine/tyrosine aminotransferase
MKSANSVFSSLGTTIFETMSRLAQAHNAVNLGQGFPEGLEPAEVVAKAAQALTQGSNQYPSMLGTPELRQAIARHEQRFYGIHADPQTQVLVTSGATEALAACLFGLIEPGDEVIVFEPLYDSYLPIIRRAGGIPKPVRLYPPSWEIPRDELVKAFGPKTKLVLMNNPTNPSGKVWTRAELDFLAAQMRMHDALAVCDEVYEHLVYDGQSHIPLMTLPGMADRCLKVGSAGKIFSLTGWKVGWVVGNHTLLTPVIKAHQFLTFTTAPNLQAAVAFGLDQGDAYYRGLVSTLAARRDRLAAGLAKVGFDVFAAPGSYFINAGFLRLPGKPTDAEFCLDLTEKCGVAAIPVSAFYDDGQDQKVVRFCFAKTEAVIDEAITRLQRYFG